MKENYKNKNSIRFCLCEVMRFLYHWNDAITIIYVVEGELDFSTWTGKCRVKENDLIVLERRVVHNIEAISNSNKVMMVSIDWEFYKDLFPNYKNSFIHCNSTEIRKNSKLAYEMIKEQCKKLLFNLILYRHDIQKEEITKAATEFIKLLIEKFNFLNSGIKHKDSDRNSVDIYRKLFNQVMYGNDETNDSHRFTLKQMSDNLGVNYENLKKGIFYRFGHSYSWFKNAVMRGKAIRMLLTTEDTIMQIGYNCGFSDPKYLISSFKKYYSCTPSEFRERYGNRINRKNIYREFDIDAILNGRKYKSFEEVTKDIINYQK